jgi:photosystem II stability/assembly factor-like uncharacterized protein
MKTAVFVISLMLFISNSYSQFIPETHLLQDEKKDLYKSLAQNPASNSITSILTLGDTVWLGTSRGVSVSFNRGENWTNFFGTSPFGEDGITAIGYTNGTVWAATVTSVEVPGGSGTVAKGTGLKYTTDNGQSWTALPQPLDNPNDSVAVYGTFGQNRLRVLPITVAEQNVTYDIAFTPNTVWITSFAGGLRKSTNRGETWERVFLPTDSLNYISPDDTLTGINLCISPAPGSFCGHDGWLNYRAFSVISTNDSTLYVGTADGINKSTDNGISWRKFNHQNQDNSISGNFVVALGYNTTNNSVWAATWRAQGSGEYNAVSSSTDGGENWKLSLIDERVNNFGFKNTHTIAASENGAFRTTNLENTWILPTSIIDDESKVKLSTNVFYSASTEGNYIWLGTNDGLVRLIEGIGDFWEGEWKIYFASVPLETAERNLLLS